MENWQRLEKVIKWAGMSVNAFALNIGLKRSENLYQIKKGNHGISKELANIISEKYPNISKSWLLTGEGTMLKDGDDGTGELVGKGVPFYNIDIALLTEFGQQQPVKPVYYINVPIFNDCTLAALTTGNAMYPDIPAGAIVMLKEHDREKILPGESYLILTPTFSGIRNIRNHPNNPQQLRLVPKNQADYDEMTIDREEIEALYLVKGVIISKTL